MDCKSCHAPQMVSTVNSTSYIGDSDLLLLREDLSEEIGSVVAYIECAVMVKDYQISKLFRQVATEELNHYAGLLQLVTGLDQVQAEELKKQELLILAPGSEEICPYRPEGSNGYKHDYKKYYPDERIWECLRNAIRDELLSINSYQRQAPLAANPAVQGLLVNIMNKEKEHFVAFTKVFYDIYGLRREGMVLAD